MKIMINGKNVSPRGRLGEMKAYSKTNYYKVAEYKFDNSSDVFPEFNEGYAYIYEDVVEGNNTTRTIYGTNFPKSICFQNLAYLLEVHYIETSELTSAYNLFYNCAYLTYVDLSYSDFSKVTTMERMFTSCPKLTTIVGLNDLDVSNVNNMGGLFSGCNKLTDINISNWDVSKVTNFGAMFRYCNEIITMDLKNWDTSSAEIMSGIFTTCNKLTTVDVSGWNIDNVTTLNQAFYGCGKLTSLSLFNYIGDDVDIRFLVDKCSSLNEVELLNSDYNTVNKVISALPTKSTSSRGTLNIAGVDDISQVNVNGASNKYWNVIDNYMIAEYKFDNTVYDLFPEFNEGFEYTYSDIVEGNVTTRTIYSNELPTLIKFGNTDTTDRSLSLIEIIHLNTSNLRTMNSMFNKCKHLNTIDAIDWDTSKVTNMRYAFLDCTSLTTVGDLSNWDTSNVTNMEGMFMRCYASNIGNSIKNWNVSKVVNMDSMLDTTLGETSYDLSNWDVSKVTNMTSLFGWAYNLTYVNLSNWDTGNVTIMDAMFAYCNSLSDIIGIENFDVSNVESFTYDNTYPMFLACRSLSSLDLSKWNINGRANMNHLFYGCQSLSSLNLSNWEIVDTNNMDLLFLNCEGLNEIIMNNSDYTSVNKIILELPERTVDNPGTLDITGIDNLSLVDINIANSKYWNIIN